ncbi:MAG: NHL repeat-containing protein [Thermodesulfobacteriota bacterium]
MHPMSPALKLKVFLITLIVFMSVSPTVTVSAEKGQMELMEVITGNEMMGRFNQPTSIFFDETKKRFYISDAGADRLLSFDNEFFYIAEFKQEGLELPVGVVKNKRGQFFVVSGSKAAITFIDVKEKVIKTLVFSGVPEKKEGVIPGRIAIDNNDRLYVTDRLNKRIIVLDSTGVFVREITVENEESYGFTDVRVDERGNLYALDTIARTVYVFNREGEMVSRFGSREIFDFPTSLAVDSKGLIYVVDQHQGNVKVFDMKGSLLSELFEKGRKERELLSPSYIFIDKKDRFYIIDRGNNRVQIFIEEGK